MALITTYNPLPISFTHGKGVWLYDSSGKAYFDSTSGIAVCGLGHAHPRIAETIAKQASKLIHTSNMVRIHEQELLAERLTQCTQMQQVFFANSGAEANEAAIKLTRLFGRKKGIETPSIIVMEGAFHGRSMATLTASGSRKVQAGYEPLVPGFIRAPYNDLNAIHNIAKHRSDVVAVMLEPILGEGGIHPADESYLRQLAAFCHEKDWLFIVDEIQTGMGRTGSLFNTLGYNIKADILTAAKGLGNGFPISATLMSQRAVDLFKPGNHGSTFGGNPLACATALTVLDVIEEEGLCTRVQKNAAVLMHLLQDRLGTKPYVKNLRGRGYMLGLELDRNAMDLRLLGLEHGILLNVTSETVVRLLPPLIMNEDEIHELVARLCLSLDAFFLKA